MMKEHGVYVAPRPREGIGMAFLEQIAMGKCVVVHNDCTMTDYIQDGKNGIVRDFYGDMKPITLEEIKQARIGVRASAVEMYERWLSDKAKIVPFLERAAQQPPVHIGGPIDACLRLAYLVEALVARVKSIVVKLTRRESYA